MISPDALPYFRRWVTAVRPKTLPAALAPVMIGSSLAASSNSFKALPALTALTVALLLQVGVNLANDYFDCIKGFDTPDRVGPLRVTQSGLLSVESVRAAIFIVFALSGLFGLYLTWLAGWPVLIIGIASILSAIAYSGGPHPLASHGLGETLAFLFFGPVAVCGTFYVQVLEIDPTVISASLPTGLLIAAVLVVNNLRDIDTDRKTGKLTLAVRLGRRGTMAETILLIAGAYAIIPVYLLGDNGTGWHFLPYLTLPAAARLIGQIINSKGEAETLNRCLAQTALLSLIFSLLLSIGILMD